MPGKLLGGSVNVSRETLFRDRTCVLCGEGAEQPSSSTPAAAGKMRPAHRARDRPAAPILAEPALAAAQHMRQLRRGDDRGVVVQLGAVAIAPHISTVRSWAFPSEFD